MSVNQRATGTLLVMASSLGFAVVPTITKTAYDEGANALGVMTPRFVLAAILITAIRLMFGKKEGWPELKAIIAMLLIGAIGVTSVSLLYFLAIDQIDSSLAIVLWYAYPVVVLLLAWIFEKKRPSATIVIPLILTLTGIAISAGQVKGGNTTAIVLVVSSSLIFAFYITVLSKVTQKMGLLTAASILNIGTSIGYVTVGAFSTNTFAPVFPTNAKVWLLIAGAAVVGTTLPFLFSLAALHRIPPGMYSVITTLEPVWHIIMGVIFLGEIMTNNRIIGAALTVGGLLLFSALEVRNKDASTPVTI
ncbi:MAG: DMT family transporter [Ilumatobacteraceae bacterium]